MSEPTQPHPEDSEVTGPDSVGRWFARLLKGFAVGVGAILPGLSGGVLAVIFNIYSPMIRFLANIRKNFVKNVLYFIPVGIGGMLGVVVFARAVEAAFETYAAQFIVLFIGFVIGTFPSLFRQAGKRGRSRLDWGILVGSAVGIMVLMLVANSASVTVPPSIPVWLGSGALIGLGLIVPGLSPSNFLIFFDLYDKMSADIAALQLATIIPIAVGGIVCVLLASKVVAWMFDTHYSRMYHLILGLVVGSSLAIFPTKVFPAYTTQGLADSGLSLGVALAFGIAMLVVGTVASYLFSKVEDRVAVRREAIEAEAKEPEAV